jgi:hypothetical protein
MKNKTFIIICLLSLHAALIAQPKEGIKVFAYLPSWELYMGPGPCNNGALPVSNIDWNAFDYIIMFAAGFTSTGTFEEGGNLFDCRKNAFHDSAHAHGKGVLLCLGGDAMAISTITSAGSDAYRNTTVNNILNEVDTHHYDGIDLDFEGYDCADTANIWKLTRQLADSLHKRYQHGDPTKKMLLTIAYNGYWCGEVMKVNIDNIDFVNLMSYDYGYPYQAKTWFDEAIYTRTNNVVNANDYWGDGSGIELLSVQSKWIEMMTRGNLWSKRSKCGIAVCWNGFIASGGSGTSTGGAALPRQTWTSQPTVSENQLFHNFYPLYVDTSRTSHKWDDQAKASYISIDQAGSVNDKFITWADSQETAEIVKFAKDSCGSLILWNIGEAYLPATVNGHTVKRDTMLWVVKQNVFGGLPLLPPPTLFSPSNGAIDLSTNPTLRWNTVVGTASYHLQVSATSNYSNLVVDRIGISDTFSTITNLGSNTTYYWRANASNSGGTSAWSESWNFTTIVVPTITGVVFFDLDSNGIKDFNEPGLSGWEIYISGARTDSAITDSSGKYTFTNLSWGNYLVTEVHKTSWTQTYPIPPGQYNFTIDMNHQTYAGDFGNYLHSAFKFSVDKYWNIVSLPLKVTDPRTTVVFSSATSNAFAYNGNSYVLKDTIENGKGYWLKFGSAQNLWISGAIISTDTFDVVAGWNLIGSTSKIVSVNTINSIPSNIINSNFFGYHRGFVVASTINPGCGYWIRTNQKGKLVLSNSLIVPKIENANVNLDHFNSLTITASNGEHQTLYFGNDPNLQNITALYELPPFPPNGIFDVRFAPTLPNSTGQLLEIIPTNLEHLEELPITIRSATYPINMSWNIVDNNALYSVRISDNEIYQLSSNGTTRINTKPSTAEQILNLNISLHKTISTPLSSLLLENYPNPFNPSTMINFNIPEDGFIRLEIYNILGQKVASPVNQQLQSGKHSVLFDAARLPSGIYIAKMDIQSNANKHYTKVHPMALMK